MLVGALLSLFAAVSYTAGNLMEKVAVEKMPSFSGGGVARMIRSLVTSRLWLFGFVVSFLGLGIQVIAFSRISILVVQAVFGGGIVLLVLVARGYLREKLQRGEILGLFIAVPGLILVSLSLGSSSGGASSKSAAVSVVAWSAVTIAVAIVGYIGLRRRFGHAGFVYGLSSGLAYGVASLGSKGASTYVIDDGIVGAIPHIMASPYPYLFIVASALGLMAYQSGLQRCRIAVVGPVSSVATSVYVAVVGTALFGEHLPSNTSTLVLRVIGFGGVIVGSFFLAGAEATVGNPIDASFDGPHLGNLAGEAELLAESRGEPDNS